MKKNVILMLNRVFPVKHTKAGTPTMFANLLYANHKIHTVRMDEKGLWAKRCDEVNSGKKILSIREWTERPYRSEQREIKKLAQIGLQHITMTYSSDDALPNAGLITSVCR